jgi:hypothetical protein
LLEGIQGTGVAVGGGFVAVGGIGVLVAVGGSAVDVGMVVVVGEGISVGVEFGLSS